MSSPNMSLLVSFKGARFNGNLGGAIGNLEKCAKLLEDGRGHGQDGRLSSEAGGEERRPVHRGAVKGRDDPVRYYGMCK